MLRRRAITNSFPRHGSFFVYDLDALKTRVADMMRRIEGTGIKLWYACKANPLSDIMNVLKNLGLDFDVASAGELLQVARLGIPGDRILMTGPAKPEKLLRQALEHRVGVFVIESAAQLRLLQKLALEYDYQPRVALRVQLQWDTGTINVLGGNSITHFGVDIQEAKELIREIKLPFLGFHVFQWGNIMSIDRLEAIWQETIDQCKTILPTFEVLDVGGGVGVPYHGEDPLAWNDVVERIEAIKKRNDIPEFWLELGRYIIGPHGTYTTRVVDRKTIYGKNILVLESGINHIAKSALHNDWYPASLARESKAFSERFSLYGPLCMASDFLGEHSLPGDVEIGDFIVIRQVGAYGFTQSIPFMLCHDLAGEAIAQNQRLNIIREPVSALTWLK